MVNIDDSELEKFIVDNTGIDIEIIRRVLNEEFRFLDMKGLVDNG